MTFGDWLRARRPAPPEPLMARIISALGERAQSDAADAHAISLETAVRLLRQLLDQNEAGRETALDLLAADALVTYAFEAASESVDELDAKTEAAMLRLAALGAQDRAGGKGQLRSRGLNGSA